MIEEYSIVCEEKVQVRTTLILYFWQQIMAYLTDKQYNLHRQMLSCLNDLMMYSFFTCLPVNHLCVMSMYCACYQVHCCSRQGQSKSLKGSVLVIASLISSTSSKWHPIQLW